MKKIILFMTVFILSINFTNAQDGINYQALVRDDAGEILKNEQVNLSFDIIETSITGASVYSETHTVTTNNFGNVVAIIGQGTVVSGIFVDIEWGGNLHFLNVKIDGIDMGTTQFLSVPYALNAKTADKLANPLWDKFASLVYTEESLLLNKQTNNTQDFMRCDVINGTAPAVGVNVLSITNEGEVHRTATSGNNNMLPIAYGTINSDGTIRVSSSNVLSVNPVSTGRYLINIDNEDFTGNNYIVNINVQGNSKVNFSWGNDGSNLEVWCSNVILDLHVNASFSFVVYKP